MKISLSEVYANWYECYGFTIFEIESRNWSRSLFGVFYMGLDNAIWINLLYCNFKIYL